MYSRALFSYLVLLFSTIVSSSQALPAEPFSTFSNDLENLQGRINYTFQDVYLLARAMTHASYSEENNKPLSILGSKVLEGSVVLNLFSRNLDISAKELNNRISEFSKVTSCAVKGTKLGLEKVIRVSAKTNSSAPAVLCDAFRAIFGAVALDAESIDVGGRVFMGIRNGVGMAVAIVIAV